MLGLGVRYSVCFVALNKYDQGVRPCALPPPTTVTPVMTDYQQRKKNTIPAVMHVQPSSQVSDKYPVINPGFFIRNYS